MRGLVPLGGSKCLRRGSALAKRLADDLEQFLVVNRLVEEGGRAGFPRPFLVFGRIAACDDDDRYMRRLIHSLEPCHDEESVPGHAATVPDVRWKTDVEQDQVG